MPSENNFSTSDITLSAVLRIKEFKLLGVSRNGAKSIFVFEDRPERPGTVLQFANREISVEPIRFMEEVRNLKSLTH